MANNSRVIQMAINQPGTLSKRTLLVTSTIALLFTGQQAFAQSCGSGQVAGIVFSDTNANGALDSQEQGVAGVRVTAVNAQGQTTAETISGPDGSYSLASSGDSQTKIQFSGLPKGYSTGPVGASTVPAVSFVSGGSCNHNLGLVSLSTSCPGDPTLTTTCFVNGDPLAGGSAGSLSSVVSFPYSASGTAPLPQHQGTAAQMGSVWGLAYQRSSGKVFAGAFLKRHSGFGPLGTGGIYLVDRTNGAVSPFLNLADRGIPTGADPRGPGDLSSNMLDPSNDVGAWSEVGRIALGDLEISDDEQNLYVMNLFTKSLYRLPVGSPPVAPSAADIEAMPIDNPGCTNGDYVPMAVTEHLGELYVGVVCTAETSRQQADLAAKVLKRVGNSWQVIFEAPLGAYSRGYTVIAGIALTIPDQGGMNRPWLSSYSDLPAPPAGLRGAFYAYPQLMLSNIRFADDGSMALGFSDRTAHQFGPFNFAPVPESSFLTHAPASGELLRVFKVNGNFVLENNGTCPSCSPTLGTDNLQGPGGGEFFHNDNDFRVFSVNGQNIPVDVHQEVALGSMVIRPGTGETVATVYNPLRVRETSGFRVFDMSNGDERRSYQVYEEDAPGRFGKANGLGDLELLCDAPLQQIGDRIWLDRDADGVQDATESGIAGVTVQLIDGASGTVIATALTNQTGHYYFNSISPNKSYIIRLGNAADYRGSGPLAGRTLTVRDATDDLNDSDGQQAGDFVEIRLTSDKVGISNHSYDIGFIVPDCPTRPLGDVSASIDSEAATLHILSQKAVRAIRSARKLKVCKSNQSERELRAILAAQNDLYHAVWTGAWSVGASTVTCTELPANCTTVSTAGLTSSILRDTQTMSANLDKLVSNRCRKARGFKAKFASYRRGLTRAVDAMNSSVARLGSSLTSCR